MTDAIEHTRAVTFTGQPLTVRIEQPADGRLLGLVVLIHGMAEHHGRYDNVSRLLTDEGFAVARFDLPGHGRQAQLANCLGHFADQAAEQMVVADLRELFRLLRARFPDTPRVLLGHSMGSLLARRALLHSGDTFAGCVLSGTVGKNRQGSLGRVLAGLIARLRGPRHVSPLLTAMLKNSYGKHRRGNAWLSRDENVVAAYNADPLCGFPLTASSLQAMLAWAGRTATADGIKGMPADCRYLLLSGTADPVGGYGRGVSWLEDQMTSVGLNVTCHLYPDARHEVFNELNRLDVYADLLDFLKSVAQEQPPIGGNT